MTTTERTTKTAGGLIARLFPKNPQPTPADVEQQIYNVEAERAQLQRQRAELDQQIVDAWGDDTATFEAQAVALDSKLRAAGQVLQRLQAERVEALKRQIEAEFEDALVQRHVTPRRELLAFENADNLAAERLGLEIRAERARRRLNIVYSSPQKATLINDILKRYPADVQQGMIARLQAIEAKYADVLTLNIVSLDILESGLFKRDNHHER